MSNYDLVNFIREELHRTVRNYANDLDKLMEMDRNQHRTARSTMDDRELQAPVEGCLSSNP